MNTTINLHSEAARKNPYPAYDKLRRAGPAVYDEQRNLWYVGRYNDVFEVLRDHRQFSNAQSGVEFTLLGSDGTMHARARGIVQPAFSPARLALLAEPLQKLADNLASRVASRDQFELVEDYAVLIPTSGIVWMLGIDERHLRDVRRWSAAILKSTGARRKNRTNNVRTNNLRRWTTGLFDRFSKREKDTGDMAACKAFFIDHFNQARQTPNGGWLTDALINNGESENLSPEEMLDIAYLLIVAGTETTTDLIVNASLILATHPELQARIGADRALVKPFVEEVLRFDSPVQRRPRMTTCDVRIGEVDVPAGAQIELMLGSANRDPEKFPDADQLRLDRDPNRHVTFGAGPHFCLGAELARIEATAALNALLDHIPEMTLACLPKDLDYPANLRRRGPESLPIRLA